MSTPELRPGSDEALAQGCTCMRDSAFGSQTIFCEIPGMSRPKPGSLIHPECPLHGSQEARDRLANALRAVHEQIEEER